MTKATLHKLQTYINSCLRKILRVYWPEKITNEELWRIANQEPIATQILRRKWSWIGHTVGKLASNITRQARRKRERPRNTWRSDSKAEMQRSGRTWRDLEKAVQSRVCWGSVADGLYSSWG